MKTALFLLSVLCSLTAQAGDYQTWSEKYHPKSPLRFRCNVEYWVGDNYPFTITFSQLDYSGSNGGYIYTKITRTAPADLSEGPIKEFPLFVGTGLVQGLYVFEDRFTVLLTGEVPLDGNIDNNLYLSKTLDAQIYRGSGKCVRVDD